MHSQVSISVLVPTRNLLLSFDFGSGTCYIILVSISKPNGRGGRSRLEALVGAEEVVDVKGEGGSGSGSAAERERKEGVGGLGFGWRRKRWWKGNGMKPVVEGGGSSRIRVVKEEEDEAIAPEAAVEDLVGMGVDVDGVAVWGRWMVEKWRRRIKVVGIGGWGING